VGRTLVFGSELKAIRALDGWQGRSIGMRCALSPAQLHPGTPLDLSQHPEGDAGTLVTIKADGTSDERSYWSLAEARRRGANPLDGDVDRGPTCSIPSCAR